MKKKVSWTNDWFLVFTKLGSQLTAEKLSDLAIIPLIFIVQTFVSYICGYVVSKCFRFEKRRSNFVKAMAVSIGQSIPFYDYANEGCIRALGFWQLQLPPHFSRHVTFADDKRPSLGSYAQR